MTEVDPGAFRGVQVGADTPQAGDAGAHDAAGQGVAWRAQVWADGGRWVDGVLAVTRAYAEADAESLAELFGSEVRVIEACEHGFPAPCQHKPSPVMVRPAASGEGSEA